MDVSLLLKRNGLESNLPCGNYWSKLIYLDKNGISSSGMHTIWSFGMKTLLILLLKSSLWQSMVSINVCNTSYILLSERLEAVSANMPETSDDFTLLQQYHQQWQIYRDQINFLPGPFRTLEEELLNINNENCEDVVRLPLTRNLMLSQWYSVLEVNKDRLVRVALNLIKMEREGQSHPYKELIVSLKESLAELSDVGSSWNNIGLNNDLYYLLEDVHSNLPFAFDDMSKLYDTIWRKNYFEATRQFYKQRADGVLQESNNTHSYMRFACKVFRNYSRWNFSSFPSLGSWIGRD